MTTRISSTQRVALELVREGRVQYGYEYQNMARKGHGTFPVFLIDGYAAYGQQGRTFAALEERGLIVIRHDLVPREHVPECTRESHTIAGSRMITIPAHEAPVDKGWRTAVEFVDERTTR